MNFDNARNNMVAHQIRSWDVVNKDILNVMLNVHREEFVQIQQRKLAFADMSLPIGHGQNMMKPVVEGRMLQALDLNKDQTVLEIGTGSAYITAILAQLCHQVVSIDIHEEFTKSAAHKLQEIEINNVDLQTADFFDFEPSEQFDRIVITGSLKSLPDLVFNYLKPQGKVFVVIGEEPIMEARIYTGSDVFQSHFDTVVAALEHKQSTKTFVL